MGFSNLWVKSYSVPIAIGGNCRITVNVGYTGPQITKALYAAIGNAGAFGFDEILSGAKAWTFPDTPTPVTYELWVDILVTSAIDPNESPYDLYAKLDGILPDVTSPTYNNIITITGGVPAEEFKNLRITNYTTPVKQGQKCQVTVAFEYQGPAQSRQLYAALGNAGGFGFDEVVAGQSNVTVPETTFLKTYTAIVNISIGTGIDPADSPYDLYAKINGASPTAISPTIYNVVYVTAEAQPPSPAFRNFKIISYTTPVGPGDYCTFKTSFEYQGPAQQKTIHAAIGNSGTFGFDEILNGEDILSLPLAMTWTPCTAEVRVMVTAALNIDDAPYDLYAKLDGNMTPILQNVLYVKGTAGEPEYQAFRISDYDSPVRLGGTCRITVQMDYRGPAVSKPLHVAVGNNGFFGFDEIISRDVTINLPAADSLTPKTFMVTLQMMNISVEDSPYDLYAKIGGAIPEAEAPVLNNVLGIEGGGPGAGDIVGAITSASPTTFEAGKPVEVTVNYDAYTDNPETQIGWQTRVTIQAGSLTDKATRDHFGPTTTQSVKLSLGTMPEASQTGTVDLLGRKTGEEWVTLSSQAITISLPGEEPPPSNGGNKLAYVALGLAGLMILSGGGRKQVAKSKSRPAKSKGKV